MPSPVELAVATYIRIWSEPNPEVRAQLIDECFAAEGRFVARSREIRGRAGLAAFATEMLADPQLQSVRVLGSTDAKGKTFRYRSALDRRDGTTLEFFDAGEVDSDGRISLLLVFAGALE